jgi:uncharacterized membrane protein YkvA (DUF1232 family)
VFDVKQAPDGPLQALGVNRAGLIVGADGPAEVVLVDSSARDARRTMQRRDEVEVWSGAMVRRGSNGYGKTRRRGPGLLGRALGMMAFLPLASRAPIYARLVFALLTDDRTPANRKILLAGAAGYLLVGRDLIPDEVPILGGLDDLVVVVLAVDLFLDGIPKELLYEKLSELDIERAAFEEDMARVRRLTPGPVRKTIRRIPQLIGQAGEALEHTGLGPKVRSWISKEGSVA